MSLAQGGGFGEWIANLEHMVFKMVKFAIGRPKFFPLPSEKWMQLGQKMTHKIFQYYRPINAVRPPL